MGWDAASPEQIQDMQDYICDADLPRTQEQVDRGAYYLSDEEVLDIIDKHGGYEALGGGWVATGGNTDGHVSMVPHGQWT
jgi:hypothetical protein